MRYRLRARFWFECALAAASGTLSVLTLAWRDWLEAILPIEPDRRSGSVEWLIIAMLVAITLVSASLAGIEFRRVAAYAQ
jgi:hypothetical protein